MLRRKSAIVVPPPPSVAGSERIGREKGKERHDRHDSSFSSVSSSFELDRKPRNRSRTSLFRSRSRTDAPPGLSPSQLTQLKTILLDIQNCLLAQEQTTASFERNLIFLLAVKELSIKNNKKLNLEWKRGLCKELNVCREELGRVFTRKHSISNRSTDAVRDLLNRLDRNTSRSSSTTRKRSSYLTFSDRSKPPLTHARQHSAPVIVSEGVTLDMIHALILELKKDNEVQRLLDDCILDAITRKCWKNRWRQIGLLMVLG
ncbi:hypothetical protein M7I_4796 [Glarea lozoyensis 74030]|uniref:Uncharacterized protein n=1 Tax=Glarea lozoyensis (strain ATCC 74030 / MF5533) TaxID=1104152 RepID=H0EQ53_GLAL7|nr:hypothetical protein M7I_4796 [Glarea lozoyensis 74030]